MVRRAIAVGAALFVLAGCSNGKTTVVTDPSKDQPSRSLCFISVGDGPARVAAPSTPERGDFEVASELTGPWRVGVLTYEADGTWSVRAPREDHRDASRIAGAVRASFTVHKSWPNASLPSLSNATVLRSSEPLSILADTGSLRRVHDPKRWPLTYTLSTPRLPSITELTAVASTTEPRFKKDLVAPSVSPAANVVLDSLPAGSPWTRFDSFRNWVLDNITSVGLGNVVSTPRARLDEILVSRRANPFELVALQTIGARWLGVPTRLVFGFDGGAARRPGTLRVDTNKNGAFYLEVHMGRLGWVPVIGTPSHADAASCTDG